MVRTEKLELSSLKLDYPKIIKGNVLTGKLICVVAPQYFKAAKSYALAAFSSVS